MNKWGQYKLKLVLFAMGALIILLGLTSSAIFIHNCQSIEKTIGNDAINTAYSVAVLIEEDIEGYLRMQRAPNAQDPYYIKMNMVFSRIKNQINASAISAEAQHDEGRYMHVLGSQMLDEAGYAAPGAVEPMGKHNLAAHLRRDFYYSSIAQSEKPEEAINGYAPIIHPQTGEYCGLVRVSYSYEYYYEQIENILSFMIVANIVMIVIIFVALLLVASLLTNPLINDHLTKLFTKSHFERVLRTYVKQANKKRKGVAILVIDIDDFKRVNDRYGHPFGDTVLFQTAQTIRKAVREVDCVARIGGDEFIAALFDTDIDTAYFVAQRVCALVAANKARSGSPEQAVRITVSIGVAEYKSDSGEFITDTIKRADYAMYRAKETKNKAMKYDGQKPAH